MFYGEFQHTVDEKGRLIIPSKFRDDLGESFVLTKGLDGCLFVYPNYAWQQIETKLKSLPMTDKRSRSFTRIFLSGASEGVLDRQGRVLIPNNLREHAEIGKDVFVIGIGERLEIWNKDKWLEYREDGTESFEDLAESLVDLGI